MSLNYCVMPGGRLAGRFSVPGDKSISHRALMLAAIARGQSRISGFLEAEDTLATLAALEAAGVAVERLGAGELSLTGRGRGGLRSPRRPLDMGNSGTATRLLSGLFSGLGLCCELRGDESLSARPMLRVVEPLRRMGAAIDCGAGGVLPIKIGGGSCLRGIDYDTPVASAQIKSALLLAGLSARGVTRLREAVATRDHTERLLKQFAYEFECADGCIRLEGGAPLAAAEIDIPADFSSAFFFVVAACIAEEADIIIENVGINPHRDAALHILGEMGADISVDQRRLVGGEPRADLRVRSSRLRGIDIPQSSVPGAIDEIPALMAAAACARGTTRLSGAAELRVKESDRIAATARGLRALGIDVEEQESGMTVSGGKFTGGEVDSCGDHRIAMAFAVAGVNAEQRVVIRNCANVATSFPGFVELARTVGLRISVAGG